MEFTCEETSRSKYSRAASRARKRPNPGGSRHRGVPRCNPWGVLLPIGRAWSKFHRPRYNATMQRSLGGDLAWNGTLNSGSDEVRSKLSRAAPQYPDQLNFEVLGFLAHTQCVPMCP
ncbi:hypothetical protein CGBL_0121410 [Corynebacterium glutamicum]|nr:hypothetical protein CGBL_0121410 [Corynebacterium glutamicum]